jgi:hypothetical protein
VRYVKEAKRQLDALAGVHKEQFEKSEKLEQMSTQEKSEALDRAGQLVERAVAAEASGLTDEDLLELALMIQPRKLVKAAPKVAPKTNPASSPAKTPSKKK